MPARLGWGFRFRNPFCSPEKLFLAPGKGCGGVCVGVAAVALGWVEVFIAGRGAEIAASDGLSACLLFKNSVISSKGGGSSSDIF